MKFKLYLITLFILTGMLWFWSMLVQKFYPRAVENFPADNLRFIMIGGLYLLYMAAFFAIEPSLRPGSFNRAAFVVWLGRKWEKELKARDQAPIV